MSKQEIGKKIMNFLTDEQTARLLSACISTLSESQRQDVLGGLQADIATTVRNILKK
ncbi:MAG: hypothetical protein L3J03_03485 [Desulfobacterales bacterium]|nr:hypothetical protein [Desulfobacterales bacterium]